MKVNISENDTTLYLSGFFYQGLYNPDTLEALFDNVRGQIESGKLNSPLSVLSFKTPTTFPDSVNLLIAGHAPNGKCDTILALKGISFIDFERNFLVIPNRKRVEQKLVSEIENREARELVMESYFSDNRVTVAIGF